MKIRELMSRPPITAQPGDDVALALQIMAWGEVRHLPVVKDGRVVGVVSERDLLAHVQDNPRLERIMSGPPRLATPGDEVAEAGRRLIDERIGCLPVVEDGQLVGIVTMSDIVADHVRRRDAKEKVGPPTVRAAMTPAPLTASPDDFLLDAVGRMGRRGVRHLPVVDGAGHLLGMLSDGDVRLALGAPLSAISDGSAPPRVQFLMVREAMSREPMVTHENVPLRDAALAFVDKRVGALPVVDEARRVIGILSYVDALRALAGR